MGTCTNLRINFLIMNVQTTHDWGTYEKLKKNKTATPPSHPLCAAFFSGILCNDTSMFRPRPDETRKIVCKTTITGSSTKMMISIFFLLTFSKTKKILILPRPKGLTGALSILSTII